MSVVPVDNNVDCDCNESLVVLAASVRKYEWSPAVHSTPDMSRAGGLPAIVTQPQPVVAQYDPILSPQAADHCLSTGHMSHDPVPESAVPHRSGAYVPARTQVSPDDGIVK